MKIFVNVEKTLGNEFVFLGAFDWVDFEDKEKVLGTKISALSLLTYEKVVVKVPIKCSSFAGLEKGKPIVFEGLEASVWVRNGYPALSCCASGVRA